MLSVVKTLIGIIAEMDSNLIEDGKVVAEEDEMILKQGKSRSVVVQ